MEVIIVAIDIGIIHLALVWTLVNLLKPSFTQVLGLKLIDLTQVTNKLHKKLASVNTTEEKPCTNNNITLDKFDKLDMHGKFSKCLLPHSNNIADRMLHFFELYKSILDSTRIIFVEQQPPMGHQAVEQLILQKYRDKFRFVYPRSLHKHFEMAGLDYNGRKQKSIQLALKFNFSNDAKREFERLIDIELKHGDQCTERAHDVADAVLILAYGINGLVKVSVEAEAKKLNAEKFRLLQEDLLTRRQLTSDTKEFFNRFAHNPPRSKSSFLNVCALKK